jgi:lipopolysaccharide export system protein LptA
MPMASHPIALFLRHLRGPAGLCCALWLAPAWAERADREQPMNAEADSLRYDEGQQTSDFQGNVVITKGSIIIRGERVVVRQDAQGNQYGNITGNTAKPAFFRQKRDAVNEFIEGQAQLIEYNSQANTVKFSGQAVLRRYKGATLNDETAGSVIVYNSQSEVFTVDGDKSNPTANNPSGRVRAMITPNRASPPTSDAPRPALKPSTTLEPRR